MRRILCLLSACSALTALGAPAAWAGDRYGPTRPTRASQDEQVYKGPVLGWSNKAPDAPDPADASPVTPDPTPIAAWAKRAQAQIQSQAPAQAQTSTVPSARVQTATQSAPAAPSPARMASIAPRRAPVVLSAPSSSLPTSLYDPPAPAQVAAPQQVAAAPISKSYQAARPSGQVITLSLADLPPPGPSLERQQAADEDADALAAKLARADSDAAKKAAAGKPSDTTDLLGGP